MPQGGAWRIAPPPMQRFLKCSVDDLKIGEVAMVGGGCEDDRGFYGGGCVS